MVDKATRDILRWMSSTEVLPVDHPVVHTKLKKVCNGYFKVMGLYIWGYLTCLSVLEYRKTKIS